MSLFDEEYGRVIRLYRGRGKLNLTNGNDLPCHITIQQVESGRIYVTCKLSPKVTQDASNLQFLTNFSAHTIGNIHGKTKDGMCFKSQGKLILIHSSINIFSSKSSRLILIAQEIRFWPELEKKERSNGYTFSVVNFEFVGDTLVEKVVQNNTKQIEQSYSDLVLKAPWGTAVVKPIPGYDSIVKKLKAEKGISITCKIVAEPATNMELEELICKMDELCRLLSLSRGTKITWINVEEYTKDGITCGIILKNAVTWPFSSLPLIDPRERSDTPLFIEKAYPTYLTLHTLYNLDIAIEQYLDAKRATAYLETRALAAVALIDSLQQQCASCHELTEIVKDFGKQNVLLQDCLKNFVASAFPSIKQEEMTEILGKIPELNRRSFLNLLKKWMDSLGLQILDSELSAIKNTRNALAHRMCFKSSDGQEKVREYFRLINLIDQVFLKLLDYEGYFININLKTLAFERRELE